MHIMNIWPFSTYRRHLYFKRKKRHYQNIKINHYIFFYEDIAKQTEQKEKHLKYFNVTGAMYLHALICQVQGAEDGKS